MILKSDFYTWSFKVVLGHIRNIYDLLFKYNLSDHFIYNQINVMCILLSK